MQLVADHGMYPSNIHSGKIGIFGKGVAQDHRTSITPQHNDFRFALRVLSIILSGWLTEVHNPAIEIDSPAAPSSRSAKYFW
jgi:hypothetical protein